jgi:hypothetical protein
MESASQEMALWTASICIRKFRVIIILHDGKKEPTAGSSFIKETS